MFCRRDFLRYASSAVLMPSFLEPFAAQAANGGPTVVAIMLAGGCDGLNTVIPLTQYGTYSTLRTPSVPNATMGLNIPLANLAATAFDANPATPATSASQYAFHPSMTALRSVYGAGRLAVVTGIGTPTDELNRLSHEVGQFDWQTGTINSLGYGTTGWMGLALDSASGATLPAMVSLTGQSPILMQGKTNTPLVLAAPIESFRMDYGTSGSDLSARSAQFTAIDGQPTNLSAGEYVRGLSNSTTSFLSQVQTMATNVPASDYPKPTSALGTQLQQIARLMIGGGGSRAYFAVHGGFDSHSNQNNSHPKLVQQFSDAVSAFYSYIQAKGVSSNVIIMTFTDFGRRAKANDNYGTDHGSAAVSFVMGDPVRGGVYGQYPDLTKLDNNGNMQIQVDFRNQISDVVHYLGADPTPIVGKVYGKLGFI